MKASDALEYAKKAVDAWGMLTYLDGEPGVIAEKLFERMKVFVSGVLEPLVETAATEDAERIDRAITMLATTSLRSRDVCTLLDRKRSGKTL